jgi:hypothetical protein
MISKRAKPPGHAWRAGRAALLASEKISHVYSDTNEGDVGSFFAFDIRIALGLGLSQVQAPENLVFVDKNKNRRNTQYYIQIA